MKALLIGGPRHGLELTVRDGLSTVKVAIPAGPTRYGAPEADPGPTVALYHRAEVRVAGIPVAVVFCHEHERPTRQQALEAIGRLYLAGAFSA